MKFHLLVFTALVFLCFESSIAQRGEVTVTQSTEALRQPALSDSVAATLTPGATLRICQVSGDWLKALDATRRPLWVHKDATNVLPVDRAIIVRDALLYDMPGHYNAKLRAEMSAVGEVPHGSVVRVEEGKGGWYHIGMDNGKDGWVHQMFLARSLLVPARVRIDIDLCKDTSNMVRSMTNFRLYEDSSCVVLGHGTQYVHVRAGTGQEGWLFASQADYDDVLPVGHKIGWLYTVMKSIDSWGDGGWKWLATFAFFWFILPFAYSLIFSLLGFIGFGRIRFLSNFFVKIGIFLTAFAGLLIITNVAGEVYPYSDTTLGTLWSLAFMLVPPITLSGEVDKMRCRKCKTMGRHRTVATAYAGTHIKGTVSSSGTVNVSTTDHHILTYECLSCKHRWQLFD